ncbi:bifunctional homocysteine S-methyltransferase/methylenetetrahydrofolate reductase [Paenibacillus senegalensis]|uniref:bifunctional homocysteine S-methyltransferase/methylenetetrahydrofolate reductase n=1 Tax=Paenibacillus senegalensis TaxID=1465766 RepID=UPI000289754F|nr:bifunctional homocysteine S-methyltransferase/methylenetetrahydrofolate reductase [Paenibacillus senegalensis]
MKADLRTLLQRELLVGDGAMGTYLYQLGFPVGISYEEFNLTKPEVIIDVHRRYCEAGARLLETNTFSASRERLAKYGLENEVKAINREGVKLARQAGGDDAFIIGAVGSVRGARRTSLTLEEIAESFQEQLEALLEEDPDGILLETFYEFDEIQVALETVRKMSELPVICQFATEVSGVTKDGITMDEAFNRLLAQGADVVGFNCHSGPMGLLRAMEKLQPIEHVFSVYPNAGLPGYIDGKFTYTATPEYFAEAALRFAKLGARIIGGCCGTTPEHIAAISAALQNYKPGEAAADVKPVKPIAVKEPQAPGLQAEGGGEAAEGTKSSPNLVELVRQRRTVIVELDPPRGLSVATFMKGARVLKDAGVDSITMADNSLAMTRMSNIATGFMVKEKLGIPPLLHVACRDRNLIGTQAHLMGLHAMGIDHLLCITGDPAKFGDLPGSSSVYDLNSIGLIKMAKQLNEGTSHSGKALKHKANFVIGAALDPNVKYLDKAVGRMEKKIEAGADYFMTQPVYDPAMVERLYHATRHIEAPIFLGIMPLISGRNAEFLHNEVPGIRIPDDVRKRMSGLEQEEGRRMGIQIAKELLDMALPYFNGFYFMTPMLYYEMTAELTRYVHKQPGGATS